METEKNENRLDLQGREDFLPLRPHRLISLWDMIQFLLHLFVIYWNELQDLKKHFEKTGKTLPGQPVVGVEFDSLKSVVAHLHSGLCL
jgi:hypothetical protein